MRKYANRNKARISSEFKSYRKWCKTFGHTPKRCFLKTAPSTNIEGFKDSGFTFVAEY